MKEKPTLPPPVLAGTAGSVSRAARPAKRLPPPVSEGGGEAAGGARTTMPENSGAGAAAGIGDEAAG